MIDALTTSGTAVAGNSLATGGLPAQADFKDVERFRAAMMAPQGQAPQATLQPAPLAAEAAPPTPPAAPAAPLPSPLMVLPSAVPPAAPAALAPPTLPSLPAASSAPVLNGKPAGSLGETILNAMNDLSADTRQRFDQVGQLLAKPDLNMSDLMSLQFTLLQTSLQFEIASKGISKVTQNLDSILKTQ
ncbi:MAG: EscI/YscI/HrpB family type III secretion system inner rod protein [Betaproteobacteria bacterium]